MKKKKKKIKDPKKVMAGSLGGSTCLKKYGPKYFSDLVKKRYKKEKRLKKLMQNHVER